MSVVQVIVAVVLVIADEATALMTGAEGAEAIVANVRVADALSCPCELADCTE